MLADDEDVEIKMGNLGGRTRALESKVIALREFLNVKSIPDRYGE